MLSRLSLAALSTLALAGCMQAEAAQNREPGGPPARVTGEPVDCIRTVSFSDTRVRDGRTIDFMRNSRQGWRNTLPSECPGLAVQRAITYKVSTGELCSVDIVYVLETAGGLSRGAGCGLGKFVPIELERR